MVSVNGNRSDTRRSCHLSLLVVKFRDLVDHKSLRFATQFWINWQSQCFRGRAFCFRKVALLMFQIEKTFLQMERNRVVNLASNFVDGAVPCRVGGKSASELRDVPPYKRRRRRHLPPQDFSKDKS